jgi:hypothetical protein
VPTSGYSRHEIDDGHRCHIVKAVTGRDQLDVISQSCRSLCRWVETAERLDHIANEFDPDWFQRRGRKHIDNPAPYRECTVLIDGILTRKSAVNEKIRESLRFDLSADPEVD